MAYMTNYLGEEMDENLEKGRDLTQITSGWIRLTSSSDSPADLSKLKNTGNYLIDYWDDGPTLDSDIEDITPINILVLSKAGVVYQYGLVTDKIYSRQYDTSEEAWTEWVSGIGSLSSYITDTEPSDPVSGCTIWVDTSESATAATIKIYIDGEWIALSAGGEVMYTSTYANNGGETVDLFAYAQTAINSSGTAAEVNEHVYDETMHLSEDDITELESKVTKSDLETAGSELSTTVNSEVETIIDDNSDVIEAFNTAYTNLTGAGLEDHIDDSDMHPTIEDRESWSDKAEKTHIHYRDGSVNVYVDNVNVGDVLSSDIVSYEAKERAYEVASTTALYALTVNPYHSGDMFYIDDGSGNLTWYLLANDKYLGTDTPEKAFILLDVTKDKTARWEQVYLSSRPTTLEGYGITDAASREDVRALNNATHKIRENTQTALWDKLVETQTAYQTCVRLIKLLSSVTAQ